jgi:hypothetical protein
MRTILSLLLTVASGISLLHADWSEITALDIPVTKLSPDQQKARTAMKVHFQAQIAANQAFLRDFPNDSHAYESRLRLAVAQARLASLEANGPAVESSLSTLRELEKQAPTEEMRAEAMFRRISLQWQNLGNNPDQRRENAIATARTFAAAFPSDRRSPRLLAEAESLCDNHPEEKAKLITEALTLSKEEPLTQRLLDDKKRLDLLGKNVDLSFVATDGTAVDVTKNRGKVTALVFWSAESAPSLIWLRYFNQYAAGVPDLKVIGISLDTNRADLMAAMQALRITWPVAYDGKGWQNGIARSLGINSLPTLWLIDREGRLTALNARDNYELKINELLLKK